MAKSSLNQGSISQKPEQFERKEEYKSNWYFDNEAVERLMYRYCESACTDVTLRDHIMEHASELIRQLIKAHNLAQIYPGKDESSVGDLFQVAWLQIEGALYKYEARPHCGKCYNKLRPNDSMLCDNFMIADDLVTEMHKCKNCNVRLERDNIYYRGKSRLFNLWCVSPNTKVLTQNGIARIGDSLDRKNQFYGLNGLSEINATIQKPKQRTVITNVMYNYNIETSPEHYLFKLGNSGPDWDQVKDLKPGDFIGLQYSQQYFNNNDDISDIKINDWQPPKTITPELAYIFGLYLAEGSYGNNMLSIYNTDLEVTELLQDNSLNLKFKYYAENCANYVCSKDFNEFMDQLGFNKCHEAKTKHIPKRLMQMSKANIEALLSGLFDGDGHSSRYNGEIGFTSTSLELIEQVRMLLLNIGILTKLYKDPRKIRNFINRYKKYYKSKLNGAYMMRLSTVNSLRFYDRVGFKIKRKQLNINKLPVPYEMTYCLGDRFRNLYNKYGSVGHYNYIRRMIDGCNRISVNKAISMLNYWKGHCDGHDVDFRFINDRLNEHYRFKNRIIWLPILKKTDSESEVCDVEISSDDHSYIANGFVSHNSQIARTVILAHIKKENRDRKNSPMFQEHLVNRTPCRSKALERFQFEARQICKHNDDYLKVLDAINQLYAEDDKPHEGLIAKLMERTLLPRLTITSFLRMCRLRCGEFTDSPANEEQENQRKRLMDQDDANDTDL
jgi:intein/homing endonuclease